MLLTFPLEPICSGNSNNFSNRLPLNDALLLIISTNAVVIITEICTLHVSQELLVMSDDDELKISLLLASSNDGVQGLGQSADIVTVQIGCWFIEGD